MIVIQDKTPCCQDLYSIRNSYSATNLTEAGNNIHQFYGDSFDNMHQVVLYAAFYTKSLSISFMHWHLNS